MLKCLAIVALAAATSPVAAQEEPDSLATDDVAETQPDSTSAAPTRAQRVVVGALMGGLAGLVVWSA